MFVFRVQTQEIKILKAKPSLSNQLPSENNPKSVCDKNLIVQIQLTQGYKLHGVDVYQF